MTGAVLHIHIHWETFVHFMHEGILVHYVC